MHNERSSTQRGRASFNVTGLPSVRKSGSPNSRISNVLGHVEPAIDVEGCAGDVARVILAEEFDHTSDFFRLPEAFHRNFFYDFGKRGFGDRGNHFRADKTRR